MSKELFQIGAFHESGHAVIGYYMGFQIDDIILLETDPGSGRTKFDYGADGLVIAGILNAKKDPSFFNSLPKESRSRTPQATTKICCTLIAGGVAEAIHKQGIEFEGSLAIGFADPDAEGINACEYVMSIIDKPRSENYVNEMVKNMTAIIRSKENWEVISSLAEALMSSANKTLLKSEIVAIFIKHNFKRMGEE
ncbi:MAG: hypothetical protein JST20_04320 [Bacteroidetes bacterium]|nr:hypothetical protein [Bacteroidota bacterium]